MANVLHSFDMFKDALSKPIASMQDALGTAASNLTTSYGGAQEPTKTEDQIETAPTGPFIQQSSAETPPPPPSGNTEAPAQEPTKQEEPQNLSQFSASTPQFDTGDYASLFAPAQQQIQKGGEQLQSALGGFYGEAGQNRGFGEEDKNLLTGAVEQGTGMDEAAKLLSTSYGGPSGLDTNTLGAIQNILGEQDTLAKSLRGTTGIQNLAEQANVNLTAGEAREQARRLQKEQGFQQARTAYGEALKQLSSQTAQGKAAATEYAKGREAGDKALVEQAKGFLTEKEAAGDTARAARLADIQAREADIQSKMGKIKDTGDAQLAFELEQQLNPEKYQAYQDWQAKRDAVLNDQRFSALAGVPDLVKQEGKKGAELKFDQDWYDANKGKWGKKQEKQMLMLARERQKALDALGAAPETAYTMAQSQAKYGQAKEAWNALASDPQWASIADQPFLGKTITKMGHASYAVENPKKPGKMVLLRDAKWIPKETRALMEARQKAFESQFGDVMDPRALQGKKKYVGVGAEGEFRNYMPLTGETPIEATKAGEFVTYQPGVEANEANIATEEERAQHNRINELLQDADILETVDPYAAGQLRAEAGRYGEQERLQMDERERALDAEKQAYLKQVNKARKSYKKSRSGISGVVNTVGNMLPGNLGDYLPQALPYAAMLIPGMAPAASSLGAVNPVAANLATRAALKGYQPRV